MTIPERGKESVIYDAVRSLLERGRPIASITISEIATAAGIGKGTVYEYFNTKEELLSRAVAFCLRQEFEEMKRQFENNEGFKNRFYALLNIAETYHSRSVSLTRLFMPEFNMRELAGANAEELKAFHGMILKLFDDLVALGRGEGLLTATESSYCHLVLFASVCGYIAFTCSHPHKEELQQARDHAYTALLKALN